MGFIKNFFARRKEREDKLKEYDDNDKIIRIIDERKKSHNERELIKILNKEREEAIKEALIWEDKRRQADEKLKARNMMKFNPEFFNGDSILKQKKIFLGRDKFLYGGN